MKLDLDDEMRSWQRIEDVLREKAPPIFNSFLPGATLEVLSSAELELGYAFPDFLRAGYLRHNGQRYRNEGCHEFLMPSAEWTSLSGCLDNWRMLSSLGPEFLADRTSAQIRAGLLIEESVIQKLPWHPGHIPIGACSWDQHSSLRVVPVPPDSVRA